MARRYAYSAYGHDVYEDVLDPAPAPKTPHEHQQRLLNSEQFASHKITQPTLGGEEWSKYDKAPPGRLF